MADAEIIALLDHIKDIGERTEKKLDEHIDRDESIVREFVRPLWEESQRRLGAAKLAAVLYTVIGGAIVAVMDYLTKPHL